MLNIALVLGANSTKKDKDTGENSAKFHKKMIINTEGKSCDKKTYYDVYAYELLKSEGTDRI